MLGAYWGGRLWQENENGNTFPSLTFMKAALSSSQERLLCVDVMPRKVPS